MESFTKFTHIPSGLFTILIIHPAGETSFYFTWWVYDSAQGQKILWNHVHGILSTILYYYMISYTLFIHYRTRNPGCVQVFSASWTQKTVLCYREWFESPQVIFFFKWRFPPCIGLRRALTFCCNYVYIQSVTKKSHDGSKWEDRLQNWSYVEDKFED